MRRIAEMAAFSPPARLYSMWSAPVSFLSFPNRSNYQHKSSHENGGARARRMRFSPPSPFLPAAKFT